MRLVAALALAFAACATGADVRPDDMPRLNEVSMHPRRYATAHAPTGQAVLVHGRFDAETVPVDERAPRLRFTAPVEATLSGGTLTLSGANLAPRQVALASLRSVHLSMNDGLKTKDVVLALELGVGLAIGVGVVLLIWLYGTLLSGV